MLNWLVNAILTRLLPEISERIAQEIAAQRDKDAKQVRELIGEMEDVLEKFSRVVAREAMRRSREAKRVLDDHQTPPEQLPGAPMSVTTTESVAERKARLRANLTRRA